METLALVQRIGGDWSEIESVDIDGTDVRVFRSQARNCSIDVAVYDGMVYLRARDAEDREFQEVFENFAEDPDVKKLIQELHEA